MLLTNGFRILCVNLCLGEFLVNRQAVLGTEPSVEVLGTREAFSCTVQTFRGGLVQYLDEKNPEQYL